MKKKKKNYWEKCARSIFGRLIICNISFHTVKKEEIKRKLKSLREKSNQRKGKNRFSKTKRIINKTYIKRHELHTSTEFVSVAKL